jgi:hypothetical protein
VESLDRLVKGYPMLPTLRATDQMPLDASSIEAA